MLSEDHSTVGSLRSAGITLRHRYYRPLRHPLLFNRFPGCSGYTGYLAPRISVWEEEGFSSCLACPCRRAAAPTPPKRGHRVSQRPLPLAAFAFPVAGSAFGATHFRGHLCVRLRCGPATRRHSAMTLSMGFRSLVSLLPAI
jgi:hypothetical protein